MACVNGLVPTLTTSSKIWSFQEHRLLLPEECMHTHGLTKYCFAGCAGHNARTIIGNSMTATSLNVFFLPVLKQLGLFV